MHGMSADRRKGDGACWVYVPRDFPGILNVWLDPGSQFIVSCKRQRRSRGCMGNKFPKLLQRKETKKRKSKSKAWVGYKSFWCLASLLFLWVVLLLLYEVLTGTWWLPLTYWSPFSVSSWAEAAAHCWERGNGPGRLKTGLVAILSSPWKPSLSGTTCPVSQVYQIRPWAR